MVLRGVDVCVLPDDCGSCGLVVDALNLVQVFVGHSEGLRFVVSVGCEGHGWLPG